MLIPDMGVFLPNRVNNTCSGLFLGNMRCVFGAHLFFELYFADYNIV